MTIACNPTVGFLDALAPHVSSDVRKGIESLKKIMEMFPGLSAGDIEKSIRAMLASATTSVPSMIERARDLIRDSVEGEAKKSDTLDSFLKDLGKCSIADLKAIGTGLNLPLPTQKKAVVEELRKWIDSKGAYAPASPAGKMRERAAELAGDLPQRMSRIDSQLAEEIIRRAEIAAKDKQLGKEGFEAFASLLLGTAVRGSKPKLLAQIKSLVDRLLVSQEQTSRI